MKKAPTSGNIGAENCTPERSNMIMLIILDSLRIVKEVDKNGRISH